MADLENLAYLLRYDTVYGRYQRTVTSHGDTLAIDDRRITALAVPEPQKLPWRELDVDLVLQRSGAFTREADLAGHVEAGASFVILSAPSKSENLPTVVHGVNRPEGQPRIVWCASCSVVDGPLVKAMAWCDNEWGFTHQMIREARRTLGWCRVAGPPEPGEDEHRSPQRDMTAVDTPGAPYDAGHRARKRWADKMRLTGRDLAMYSKVTVAGHPVHPMMITYPIACYTGTLVGFAVYTATGGLFWLRLAIALNVVGVGMALLAALPGLVDWAFGIPRDSGAKPIGLLHAGLNIGALGLFAASLAFYVRDWSAAGTSPLLGLALSAAGWLCTLGAGFLGWVLIQTYHVGIQLTPAQASDEGTVQRTRPHLRIHHAA